MKKLISGGLAAAAVTGALLCAAPAQADPVSICPSGHAGVVGNHTTCIFAEYVRAGYVASGGAQNFVAYSPATNLRYQVSCEDTFVNFTNGASDYAQQCYAGDNAEVVVW